MKSSRQGCMAAFEQVPGNIRRAEHFCAFLRRLVEHLKGRISVEAVVQESCTTFLATLQESINIDGAPSECPCSLRFFSAIFDSDPMLYSSSRFCFQREDKSAGPYQGMNRVGERRVLACTISSLADSFYCLYLSMIVLLQQARRSDSATTGYLRC